MIESTTKTVTLEVFIAMNEDGGWIITTDESEALSELFETEGGLLGRVAKIVVQMSPPTMVEAEVRVPDDAGTVRVSAV